MMHKIPRSDCLGKGNYELNKDKMSARNVHENVRHSNKYVI